MTNEVELPYRAAAVGQLGFVRMVALHHDNLDTIRNVPLVQLFWVSSANGVPDHYRRERARGSRLDCICGREHAQRVNEVKLTRDQHCQSRLAALGQLAFIRYVHCARQAHDAVNVVAIVAAE